ncbi:exopolyphosphatase-like protein [Nemania diffusa]|nr:exopolyphosphatase-like protein [Nemania diffusa]
MPPRASLKAFLATARAALTAPPSKRPVPLTFVVGNESADLDSLCSALLLAYFHTYAPPKRRASISDGSVATSTLHIPVCHLYRADLALRPEFAAVLGDADVGGADMVTLEDVLPSRPDGEPLTDNSHNNARREQEKEEVEEVGGGGGPIPPASTRWLLVDHNALTGRLATRFAARVIGCVDHHADEGAVPRDAEPRVIETSGSCASLVLELCASRWAALQSGAGNPGEGAKIDAQLARLALAPILIDTVNMTDESKTTAHDERAVGIAEGKIAAYAAYATASEQVAQESEAGEQVQQYDRTALFARVAALKDDIASMSPRDVLRKDYKEWRGADAGGLRLGTSSVPRGFAYLVATQGRGDAAALISSLAEWGAEKDDGGGGKMDLVVLLTTFQDEEGRFTRELLVWARSEAGVEAAKRFEEMRRETLGLETWGGGVLDGEGRGEWRRCWRQGAVEHGRKQIAPMLREALEEVAGSR